MTLLLALALLGGCAQAAPPEATAPRTTVLWLFEGEPTAAALAALAEEYTAAHPESPVAVRAFESEEAMGAALNTARPDLLLCPGSRGLALYAQGKLRDASPELTLSPALALDESVGRAYFPLGAEVPILAVNATEFLASPATDGADEAAFDTLEGLLALAGEQGRRSAQPFFAADSWSAFFALYLRQAGAPFDGRRASIGRSERGAALYNLLAECAYARGLYVGAEDASELLRRGYVTSALLPSRALAAEAEGLLCRPAPRLEGGEAVLPARLWGLAVTAPDEAALPGVEAFLTWLCAPERADALALDEGLLPAVPGEGGEPGSLEEALRQTTAEAQLILADESADYAARAEAFDASFRAALALFD